MKRLLMVCAAVLLVSRVPAYGIEKIAGLQMEGMRFYSVKAVDHLPGGGLALLAAGQVNHETGHDALIIGFSLINGTFTEIAREVFKIGPAGNTRIRSLVCTEGFDKGQYRVVVNGKGGLEDRERGFIRSYRFTGRDFNRVDSMAFSDPQESYTHGYPLIDADLDGDGSSEIIYGGFSGEHDRDHADIRIFSLGQSSRLSPFTGYRPERLKELPLRVNALTSGDLDGEGNREIAVAGRTVAPRGEERAAFAVFSDRDLIWKQVRGLGSCRYRYAAVTDSPGGTPVLALAGRINQGKTLCALLDGWHAQDGDLHLVSRYRFTGAGSTRLRVVKPLPGSPGRLMVGGRMEILENGRLRWQGFLQEMSLGPGTLSPSSKPVLLDKGWETRVRTLDISNHLLVTGGFTEDKTKASTAFISIHRLK